ncbi:hypothetical protein BKA62DRAFT_760480 [Auriculariales sp. MPI-PUGE-AT-0066]|nr:hypothetical protein BKA62DRAFT_760480 [Auriculariales sp. MPI-PUGE-AT-0066]
MASCPQQTNVRYSLARTRGGPHYQSKDLGHIAARDSYYATDHNDDDGVHAMVAEPPFEWDRPAFRGADRTLDELKFFPGDLLCVAVILPKSRHEKDASSAPAGAVPSSMSQPPAGVNGAKWGHVADREPAGARGGGPGWRGGASAGAGAGAGRGRGGGRGGGRTSSPPPPRRFSPPPPPPASSARGGRGRGRGGFDRGGRFGNGDGGGSGGGGDRARSRSRSRSRSRDRAPLNRDRDRDDRDRRPPLNRERDLDRDRDRRRSRSRSPPPVPSRRR